MRVLALPVFFVLAASAQDFSDIRVERVAAGYTHTEGPAWSRDEFLYFSDVPTNRIIKAGHGEKAVVARENSAGVSGNAFDSRGNFYSCETRGRRVIRMDKNGKVDVLAETFEGKRLNAPNDIVVRRDGHVYFTDPAFGGQSDTRELDFYGIYHIPPRGPMEVVAKPKGRPNGIDLSPNGRILYVANSDERSIYAYDLDGKGAAANERVLISKIDGPPDGLCVDEKGTLYVAARNLVIYSPEGKLVHTVEISETPRNCAFGDPDYQGLYITAQTSVYRIRLNVKGALHH
ncbi:MAG: SMP-30/gluconolactonase/LRE family protein [Bryobacterales bacterium]|nr:SMP-30/gluconolactonase/LRE family protein [Bryobacterales bacterium]